MRRVSIAVVSALSLLLVRAPASTAQGQPGRPALQPGTPLLERPWSAGPEKFVFAILGDKTGDGVRYWPIFDRAVDEINRLHPDFVIMVGDMVQGYVRDTTVLAAEWEVFWQHADRLNVPFFRVAGNHDVYYPEMLDWWRRHYGRTYYSFDYKGCHFLVLNSEEARVGVTAAFTPEQVRFAMDDLAAHRGARHTFVFLHKPAWSGMDYREEWEQIEASLAGRRYTVFAGHVHRLEYSRRNGADYYTMGPTGAALTPSLVRPLGAFHHYSLVTVDGDSAYVSHIEPGSIWPHDVATRSFQRAARGLVRVSPLMPQGLTHAEVRTGLVAQIANDLPDTATVVLRLSGLGQEGWRIVEGRDSVSLVVAPGQRDRVVAAFSVPAGLLRSAPRMSCTVLYGGAELLAWGERVPVFPDSVLRGVPEWHVVGPFDLGRVNRGAVPDYRAVAPRAFERLGPEEGWSARARYREGGRTLLWKNLTSEDGQVLLHAAFDSVTPMHALGYAQCAVYSPAAKQVYADVSADDYVQILVNGTALEDGRFYRESELAVISLRRGWNTVLIKAINEVSGWRFRFRFVDPAGELRFAAHPG